MALKHHNNIYQQTRFGMMNIFLVVEDDGLTVVDTGIAGSESHILKAAEFIGKPIQRIVLTHAHVDHAGSFDALAKTLPEAEMIVSEREAALLLGEMTLHEGEPQSPLKGQYVVAETKPTRLVRDGDQIGSLQVITTPGHTPGHISLLDTRDNSMIAGDAMVTLGGVVVSGKMNLLFPLPAMATWSRPLALESAKRILDANPSMLAVGHGKMVENPVSAIQKAIRSAEKTFAK